MGSFVKESDRRKIVRSVRTVNAWATCSVGSLHGAQGECPLEAEGNGNLTRARGGAMLFFSQEGAPILSSQLLRSLPGLEVPVPTLTNLQAGTHQGLVFLRPRVLSRGGCHHARGLQGLWAREVQMKSITIHPHPGVRDRSGPLRGWAGGRECVEHRRSRWDRKEGLRGEMKEDYNLECAEGNIEGAKQRQVRRVVGVIERNGGDVVLMTEVNAEEGDIIWLGGCWEA